ETPRRASHSESGRRPVRGQSSPRWPTYPPPSGRQSVGTIVHDLIDGPGVQDGHAGDTVEEPLHLRPTIDVSLLSGDAGQPILDGALECCLHILAGQAGETLCELVDFGRDDVHVTSPSLQR